MAPTAVSKPMRRALPLLLIAAALLWAALAGAPAAQPTSPGPTLAIEDTMHTEVPEVLVKAPRVTLDEILDRVARGEARRDSALKDVSFTATLRVVKNPVGGKTPELIQERVMRVYRKKPGKVRTVTMRDWKKSEKGGDADVNFSASTEEQVVNFAFKPEARRDYKYRIVGRDLLGDHLIYRIEFEPKTLLGATEPAGLVWVDTRDFVIVREELSFAHSPAPIFLKGIDRAVIERQYVNGHWVLRRLLMRAQLTVSIPRFGKAFDMAVQYDDYAINQGIEDTLFVKVKKS